MDIYSSYNSKYERWYYNIIKNAKCQIRFKGDNCYYERHHIIPKAFNGTNTNENLVLLTYREHLLCHWLLTKIYEGSDKAKMIHAFWALCTYKNRHRKHTRTPLRILEIAKITRRKQLSEENSGAGNPIFGKPGPFTGKKHTKEYIKKISGAGNPMFGRTHTKEARERIAEAQRARKGIPKSEETKRKMSDNAKRRRKKILPNGKWTWHYPDI